MVCDGLIDGSLGFTGEESAGASFLRRDGTVWTTDKDGLIMGLLAAEMTAVTGKDPGLLYNEMTAKYGNPSTSASTPKPRRSRRPSWTTLRRAGDGQDARGRADHIDPDRSSGQHAPIGGLKVTTENGWFAARPSGTEDVYKIYAESFNGQEHLSQIQSEAKALVAAAIA